jgi:hypothetical protein
VRKPKIFLSRLQVNLDEKVYISPKKDVTGKAKIKQYFAIKIRCYTEPNTKKTEKKWIKGEV